MISVVIPTYKEAGAIEETLRRAAAALRGTGEKFELIVVDDASGDGTAEIAEVLNREATVRVLRRVGKRGLATAVVDGWAMAEGDLLGVMDADLQHPPEVLNELAVALRRSGADLALASRYRAGGGTRDWSWRRRLISWGATHLAATVLPLKLASVSDPMSGMFMVRAQALKGVSLSPLGYKILLEVLGKGNITGIVEVAYCFEEREHGNSKLGARQYLEYLAHLARLARSTGQLRAWIQYGLVGLGGVALNLGAVLAAVRMWAWPLALAVPAAVELALIWNFWGNHFFTFSRKPKAQGARIWLRLWSYEKVCLPGGIVNFILTLALFAAGLPLAGAVAAGIVADGLINLLLNVPSIWRIWDRASS